MSFAQVNGSTKDEVTQQTSNSGSMSFLSGAASLQIAFRRLDEEKLDLAAGLCEEAIAEFDRARAKFQDVEYRIRNVGRIEEELNEHLHALKYDDVAKALGNPNAGQSPIWAFVQATARDKGAAAVYRATVSVIESLSQRCNAFYQAIKARALKPVECSGLLAELGADITFGAYVSAVFSKQG